MARIHLTVGDTRPPIYVQLTDPAGPVDVSAENVSVQLKFKAKGGDAILQTIAGVKLAGTVEADGVTADLTQFTVAGSGGRVRFDFPVGSLDVEPGFYEGEIEVVSAGGGLLTPRNRLEFLLKADIG